MSAFSRANLVVGPARIVRGAGSLFSLSDFAVRLDKSLLPKQTDAHGHIDDIDEDVMAKCSFTPDGRWTSAARALLWPHLNPSVGSNIFGTTDTPTVIHDSNAHKHTIVASAVTKMPSLRLSVRESMIGDCEITGVRAAGLDWATSAAVYTVALSAGTLTDADLTVASLKRQIYNAVWGSEAGFTAISTEDGWTVDFEMELAWHKIEEVGTAMATLVSASAMATCVPLGTSMSNIDTALRIQATGGSRGRSAQANSADLIITGADASTIVTLKSASLVKAGYRFGSKVLRDGEMGWVSTRPFTAGVAGAFCTLA